MRRNDSGLRERKEGREGPRERTKDPECETGEKIRFSCRYRSTGGSMSDAIIRSGGKRIHPPVYMANVGSNSSWLVATKSIPHSQISFKSRECLDRHNNNNNNNNKRNIFI
ncbi:hypothetical protein ALC57_08397 [Trachymyrmex cornetzi]|uniref:Uncharacterized protein n=1 Tax=Trachymyrmex cornetzi TaxID=471704 RepID=A0A195E245_9HYME|nr:hypothetical protein ALC57_08397 [Trachymyrmex cornetzi]